MSDPYQEATVRLAGRVRTSLPSWSIDFGLDKARQPDFMGLTGISDGGLEVQWPETRIDIA